MNINDKRRELRAGIVQAIAKADGLSVFEVIGMLDYLKSLLMSSLETEEAAQITHEANKNHNQQQAAR